MDFLTPQLIFNIASMALAAAAIYGGIRSDIRSLFKRIERAERVADRAHSRIDNLLE